MYSRVTRSIMINGELKEEFAVEAGVPQGAVLSPFFVRRLYQWTAQGSQRPRAGDYGVRSKGSLVTICDDIGLW
jgi:hypothetical protein